MSKRPIAEGGRGECAPRRRVWIVRGALPGKTAQYQDVAPETPTAADLLTGFNRFRSCEPNAFGVNRRQGSRQRLSLLSGRQINLTSQGAPELCVQARLYPFQVCTCRRVRSATGRFISPEHPHRVRKPLRPVRTGAALTMRRCRAARALWPLRWLSGCTWAARSRA